ncbi:T6SS amidase immunity protein Tai4 family protein [Burkholderia ambifaria]|uniref:T6SS amidase immunity protein Tai4 family protein n=1 Tax=Burkholderia ambifaria TaxID=152480 RepID=UPI001B98F6B5|nr:T6SS amidase immunity protein Tai4 family protein [Burkholderia ambifaria]MBR8256932.1 hypothetical protein [Burkholderia ambifaria]
MNIFRAVCAVALCLALSAEGADSVMAVRRTNAEKGDRAVERLAERHLRRDYGNPVEGYAGAEFALLKCLDLYHSPELDEHVRRYVPHPDWIGDKPARRGGK